MTTENTTQYATELVVVGSGPGGYSCAFRAADLGKKVILIERYPTLGGVCLNVGCIPSKALLHAAKVIDEAQHASDLGIAFGTPKISLEKLRSWKASIIKKLTGGLKMLAKKRNVQVLQGTATFESRDTLIVTNTEGKITRISFDHAVIASGSRPVQLPFIPKDPRILDSTKALDLSQTHGRMLIIGGGIIGLEMATVYSALGTRVNIVEYMDQLIPGADQTLVNPLYKRIQKKYENIWLKSKVTQVEAKKEGVYVHFEGKDTPRQPACFDRILVAVGRTPNTDQIGLENLGITPNNRGFIMVDNQLRTQVSNIFAIGDIIAGPMLAHKAIHEGRTAAEVLSGMKHYFEPKCIPSVAYTDPEIAWVGLTENGAIAENIPYEKHIFPHMALGRALAQARTEGLTQLLFDPKTRRILGAGIVGMGAGELISETALAIEMGCDVADIALTIHPHPTLSESIMLSAEMFEGTITDIYIPKDK